MMDWWNVGILGITGGKKSILQKKPWLHLMVLPAAHPFSSFA